MLKLSWGQLLSFSTARYLSFVILIMRGFLVAKILGPEAFGLYSLTIILQQQFSIFGLGVRESVSLQLAEASTGDKRFLEISAAAFWFTILVILILNVISGALFEINYVGGYNVEAFQFAFMLAAFTISTEIFANIARACGQLGFVMLGEIGYAMLSIIMFYVVGNQYSNVSAFLNSLLFCNVIVYLYYAIVLRKFLLNSSFFLPNIKHLITLGIPILVQNTLAVFLYSSGHYYLSITASKEQLGVYSFAFSLALAGQLGVQSVLWAKFSEMLSLFNNNNDVSAEAKKSISSFIYIVLNASLAFLILAIILMKLILYLFVSTFFPEFMPSVTVVFIIFMALYWPVLAASEATALLANKLFSPLYISSGLGILSLLLMLLIYEFVGEAAGNFQLANMVAVIICVSNFVFYCMLKFAGASVIGGTIFKATADIVRAVTLVCFLGACYYSNGTFLPVLAMTGAFLIVFRNLNSR